MSWDSDTHYGPNAVETPAVRDDDGVCGCNYLPASAMALNIEEARRYMAAFDMYPMAGVVYSNTVSIRVREFSPLPVLNRAPALGLGLACILIIAFLLSGCALPTSIALELNTPTLEPYLQVAAGMETQAAAVYTPEPSATPSPAPTATPDALQQAQQKQAALAVELAQAKNTAEMARVFADDIQTEIVRTQSAATQSAAGQQTVVAALTQTPRAAIVQTEQSGQTATPQAAINAKLQAQADWEPVWQGVKMAAFLVVVLAVLTMGISLATVWYRQIQEQRAHFRAMTAEPEYIPLTPTGTLKGFVSGINLVVFAGIATREQLERIGRLVVNGASFSHGAIVDAGIMTETYFTALQSFCCGEIKIADWIKPDEHKAGCKLTDKGLRFFSALVKSPPPPQQYAPETPSAPPHDTTDGGLRPLPGGGQV